MDIEVALRSEGLTRSQISDVLRNLEGKHANWEQFKAEADAVAGRHLTTLDYVDKGVELWRNSQKTSSLNEANQNMASIFELHPELNTETYKTFHLKERGVA